MIFQYLLCILLLVTLGRVYALTNRPSSRRNLRLSPVHKNAASTVFPLDVSGGCTARLVIAAVAETCDCLPEPFLSALLGIEEEQNRQRDDEEMDNVALKAALGGLCATAWAAVETSSWQDVDQEFSHSFMEQFVHGETYLNRKCFSTSLGRL